MSTIPTASTTPVDTTSATTLPIPAPHIPIHDATPPAPIHDDTPPIATLPVPKHDDTPHIPIYDDTPHIPKHDATPLAHIKRSYVRENKPIGLPLPTTTLTTPSVTAHTTTPAILPKTRGRKPQPKPENPNKRRRLSTTDPRPPAPERTPAEKSRSCLNVALSNAVIRILETNSRTRDSVRLHDQTVGTSTPLFFERAVFANIDKVQWCRQGPHFRTSVVGSYWLMVLSSPAVEALTVDERNQLETRFKRIYLNPRFEISDDNLLESCILIHDIIQAKTPDLYMGDGVNSLEHLFHIEWFDGTKPWEALFALHWGRVRIMNLNENMSKNKVIVTEIDIEEYNEWIDFNEYIGNDMTNLPRFILNTSGHGDKYLPIKGKKVVVVDK